MNAQEMKVQIMARLDRQFSNFTTPAHRMITAVALEGVGNSHIDKAMETHGFKSTLHQITALAYLEKAKELRD